MKLAELRALENEIIAGLRLRAQEGDNKASKIILNHLRKISKDIAIWQQNKDNEHNTKTTGKIQNRSNSPRRNAPIKKDSASPSADRQFTRDDFR